MIEVSYSHIPEESLDNVILAWWCARSDDPFPELKERLQKLSPKEYDKWLGDILSQDLPIREFIPVFYIIENVPRSAVDQIDRSRVGVAFWEQSLRVKDLTKTFDYFIPPGLDKNSSQIYEEIMSKCRDAYIDLIGHGVSREMARGVVPLHINVRLSVQANLRSVLTIVSHRICHYAQSGYWRPIAQGLLDGLWKFIPALKDKNILTIPCIGKSYCPYEKDVLDRREDASNPVCPILIDRFLPKKLERKEIISEMVKRYPNYIEDSIKYVESVNEDIPNFRDAV